MELCSIVISAIHASYIPLMFCGICFSYLPLVLTSQKSQRTVRSFYLNPAVLQLYKKGGCFIALWRKENILGGLSYDFSEMPIKNFCCLLLKYFQSQIKQIQQTVQGHRS